MKELPLPGFYDPSHASKWSYRVNTEQLLLEAQAFRKRHHIRSMRRRFRDQYDFDVELYLIGAQRDFCLPEGAMYAGGRSGTGPIDDNRRLVEFIYRNLAYITEINLTFKEHVPFQIFSPSFWVDRTGNHLQPFSIVTAKMIRDGEVRPSPGMDDFRIGYCRTEVRKRALNYCRKIELRGHRLELRPLHCLMGSEGAALTGVIEEAVSFHSYVHNCQPWFLTIEDDPRTETYGLNPMVAREEGYHRNLRDWQHKDIGCGSIVIVAGQPASHDVIRFVEEQIERRSSPAQRNTPDELREALGAIYVLTDCMSAFVRSDGDQRVIRDYMPDVAAAFARWSSLGISLVRSTDPIETWPWMGGSTGLLSGNQSHLLP